MLKGRTATWLWVIPIALATLFLAVILAAPAEKTIGEAIRLVYAHVAFTRAGIFGFYVTGILGAIIAASANPRIRSWAQTTLRVSLVLFLVGGLFSVFAQRATWGGMLLAEPRNRTSLMVVAVALIVLVLTNWLPWTRINGLLCLALALFTAWIIPQTPLVLHPGSAGSDSASVWIRYTFPALTILASLFGVWLIVTFERTKLIYG